MDIFGNGDLSLQQIQDAKDYMKTLGPTDTMDPALGFIDPRNPYSTSNYAIWSAPFVEEQKQRKELKPLIESIKELGELSGIETSPYSLIRGIPSELTEKESNIFKSIDLEKAQDPKNRYIINTELQSLKHLPGIKYFLEAFVNGPKADARNGIRNLDFVSMSDAEASKMHLADKNNLFRFVRNGDGTTLVFRNLPQKASATTPTQGTTTTKDNKEANTKDSDGTDYIPEGEEFSSSSPQASTFLKGTPKTSSGYSNVSIPRAGANSKTSSEKTNKQIQQMVPTTETEGKGPEGRKDNPYIEKEVKNNKYDWLGGLLGLLAVGGMGYLYGRY